MKKLFMIFFATTIAMTGCMPGSGIPCECYFNLENETTTELVVEIAQGETDYQLRTIPIFNKVNIQNSTGHCDREIFLKPDSDRPVFFVSLLKINGDLISTEILASKYWSFYASKSKNDHNYFCTLTLTDELLEKFRIPNAEE